MGGGVEYRVLLDAKAVDRDLYLKIETITVEQTMDLAAEARIELEMCSDKRGVWNGPTDAHARAWRRARIEVKSMSATWVPLIDGPIVAWDANMQGEPGRSTMTLVVRDDSVYLNRDVEMLKFEGKSDTDVAKEILRTTKPIASVDVDPLPARPKDQPLKLMKVCTKIELLHELARPFARHVFVRPGDKPTTSIGCVKAIDAKRKPTLPAIVLVGPKRNIDSFHVRSDAAAGARHAGARLDIGELAVKTYSSSWRDVDLVGDENPLDEKQVGVERIAPIDAAFHDVEEIAKAKQQQSSFVLVGRGSIRAGCYGGVLTAYDVVATSGVNQKLCTTWLIKEVTHTLTRSEYRQDFTLIGNAVAKVSAGGVPIPTEVLLP